MSRYYTLDEEGRTRLAPDLMTWARWFETADRHLALTETAQHSVSTVFLGVDHGWGNGPAILWETMTFDKDGSSIEQWRYATRDDALAGHATAVKRMERLEAEHAGDGEVQR